MKHDLSLSTEEILLCERLRSMKLSGMEDALETQLADPNADLAPFMERFSAIVSQEWQTRYNKKFMRFLKKAHLRYPDACLDETIYDPARKLDTTTIERLATCHWIDEGENLLITGYDKQRENASEQRPVHLCHSAAENSALYPSTHPGAGIGAGPAEIRLSGLCDGSLQGRSFSD